MKTFLTIVLIFFLIEFLLSWYPLFRTAKNSYDYEIQKIDKKNKCETLTQVPYPCHAMQVSYAPGKHVWKLYHELDNEENLGWEGAVKMRANKTAVVQCRPLISRISMFGNCIAKMLMKKNLVGREQ